KQGVQGKIGATGVQGAIGVQGNQGVMGPKGNDGKDADAKGVQSELYGIQSKLIDSITKLNDTVDENEGKHKSDVVGLQEEIDELSNSYQYDIHTINNAISIHSSEIDELKSNSSTSVWTSGDGSNSVIQSGSSASASGTNAVAEGKQTNATGNFSHAEGARTVASGNCSHAEGVFTNASNYSSHASGVYNISTTNSNTFGDSKNTLFSVGNGSSDSRHNAFEIKENGDVYIPDTINDSSTYDKKSMIHLQDKISEFETMIVGMYEKHNSEIEDVVSEINKNKITLVKGDKNGTAYSLIGARVVEGINGSSNILFTGYNDSDNGAAYITGDGHLYASSLNVSTTINSGGVEVSGTYGIQSNKISSYTSGSKILFTNGIQVIDTNGVQTNVVRPNTGNLTTFTGGIQTLNTTNGVQSNYIRPYTGTTINIPSGINVTGTYGIQGTYMFVNRMMKIPHSVTTLSSSNTYASIIFSDASDNTSIVVPYITSTFFKNGEERTFYIINNSKVNKTLVLSTNTSTAITNNNTYIIDSNFPSAIPAATYDNTTLVTPSVCEISITYAGGYFFIVGKLY
ncbi:MAG: hypothetical protein NC548_24725, partial [Lachnospiraceae bacterium]|nr:hypothetical protein [Lachnospiraceae bacterium]